MESLNSRTAVATVRTNSEQHGAVLLSPSHAALHRRAVLKLGACGAAAWLTSLAHVLRATRKYRRAGARACRPSR